MIVKCREKASTKVGSDNKTTMKTDNQKQKFFFRNLLNLLSSLNLKHKVYNAVAINTYRLETLPIENRST